MRENSWSLYKKVAKTSVDNSFKIKTMEIKITLKLNNNIIVFKH